MSGAADTKIIAVLCARHKSNYAGMLGVEIYDKKRDARTFSGDCSVIAHPPCRSFSAFCSKQAKPEAGERELAFWCVDQVREFGGILEQPAHSMLWKLAGLPMPGDNPRNGNFSMEVWQCWWGFPQIKRTWLFFSGINLKSVRTPLTLHANGRDRRTWQLMSTPQRSTTPRAFCEWLVSVARMAESSSFQETISLRTGSAVTGGKAL